MSRSVHERRRFLLGRPSASLLPVQTALTITVSSNSHRLVSCGWFAAVVQPGIEASVLGLGSTIFFVLVLGLPLTAFLLGCSLICVQSCSLSVWRTVGEDSPPAPPPPQQRNDCEPWGSFMIAPLGLVMCEVNFSSSWALPRITYPRIISLPLFRLLSWLGYGAGLSDTSFWVAFGLDASFGVLAIIWSLLFYWYWRDRGPDASVDVERRAEPMREIPVKHEARHHEHHEHLLTAQPFQPTASPLTAPRNS